jgi:NAD(P)-dependent dehydrogenase (short-subunit alcohol dehydrogenase family)
MDPTPDCGETSYRGSGRLSDRKAVITGADSGIGRAVAIAFAREGADVVLSYLPDEESDAREVVELIEQAGRKAVCVPGDVDQDVDATQLANGGVNQLPAILGGRDVAGMQRNIDDITDLSDEQFDATMKTNLYSVFWLCKAAVAHMPAGSTIVNTASMEVYSPLPILVDYAATKGAISTMSKSLAQQLAPKGIRLNVVAPGATWTPLQPSGALPPEQLEDYGSDSPIGRPGQPAELAPAFVFLASPESSYCIGSTVVVNGGSPTP